MKLHSSLHSSDNKKKTLVAENGKVRFNNRRVMADKKYRTKSSQSWLKRQINDPFVNAARIEGYLARSAYKLLEIQHKYDILDKNTEIIIDLGCSPGSWSQVILTSKFSKNKHVIGLDILPVKFNHPNLHYIQGDFESNDTKKKLISKLQELCKIKSRSNIKADCVVCDIALNATGNSSTDRLRSERIMETALEFCRDYLSVGGSLVCKSLKGADASIINDMKSIFNYTYRFKPKSSRKDSSELFIIGKYKKN